jgi:long-chain fatty acid transport protein
MTAKLAFVRTLFIALSCLMVTPTVQPAAFYISEIGTPGSLGTAGVANTTNVFGADAAFTNPAGMTGMEQDSVLGGFQMVIPKIEFDPGIAEAGGSDGGNAGNVAAIPSLFAVKKLNERTRLGFSITAPLGGGMNFGDDFVGRYGAQKVELSGVALSPSVGYRVNTHLSVGAGVSALYTLFNETIAINNPGPLPDSKVKIENMDDWGLQPFAGVTIQATERLLLGAVYRAKADINLNGDLNFRNWQLPGPQPTANSAKLQWDNPQVLEIGMRYKLNDTWRLMANADWEDWSEFSDNFLFVQGGTLNPSAALDREWKDTWHVGLAAARHTANKVYSMGIAYDSSPVSDGKRTIDLPMDSQLRVSAGIATDSSKRLDYSLGATLMYAGDAVVDQTAQGVRFKGEFDNNFILFVGGSVRYVF